MSLEENKFYLEMGELKGTVGALVNAVADMKSAILPALKEQREEMAKYRDDCRNAMDIHKLDDVEKHEILESLCKPIADLHDEIYGDGSAGCEPGLKTKVNNLVTDKIKIRAWSAGVAAVFSFIFVAIGWAVEAFKR